MKKYKVGFISGFFDILHNGHIEILKEAKSQCDKLIVAVGTDDFMKTRKNRESVLNYEDRKAIVSSIRYVDQVVEEKDLDKLAAYNMYHFDVMFAGDDHKNEPTYIEASFLLKKNYGVDTVYVKRINISSTAIREKIEKGVSIPQPPEEC